MGENLMHRFSVEVINPNPILQFEIEPEPITATSTRYLAVQGQRVYDLSIVCGTCAFIYSRVKEIISLPPNDLSFLLRDGLRSIDEPIVETIKKILPSGNYAIGLITIQPLYISPQKIHDPAGWVGYGEVQDPFYQCGQEKVDAHGEIQQAIVPLFSPKSLKEDTVEKYKKSLQQGSTPTALAISIAEGKHTMMGSSYEAPDCISLMHFLIDGHHKVHAASQTGKPITLLSFLYDYSAAGLITTHEHHPGMMDVMFDRYYSN
jgi:hypothetical protein